MYKLYFERSQASSSMVYWFPKGLLIRSGEFESYCRYVFFMLVSRSLTLQFHKIHTRILPGHDGKHWPGAAIGEGQFPVPCGLTKSIKESDFTWTRWTALAWGSYRWRTVSRSLWFDKIHTVKNLILPGHDGQHWPGVAKGEGQLTGGHCSNSHIMLPPWNDSSINFTEFKFSQSAMPGMQNISMSGTCTSLMSTIRGMTINLIWNVHTYF